MREKYVFLIGLGAGLVITSIISLFLYNISKENTNYTDENITTITNTISDTTTEQTSTQNTTISTTTTTKLELSYKPSLEITTSKPFEISTN